MTQTCPACSQPASGRFCSHCGAGLEAHETCTECGNQIPAGGRFCNHCGTPAPSARRTTAASEPARPAGSKLPWIVAGALAVVLAAVLLIPRLGEDEAAPAAVSAPVAGNTAAPPGDPRSVDLSTMTPREQADRLFNRVMQYVSSGDSAQARMFLPMALAAYDRVPDLNTDGHYHVAVLQMVNDDPGAARARADSILQAEPDHLFGLFTAAQAEQEMGNPSAAREFYRRFLDRYDAEIARGHQDYQEHQQVLPLMREEATGAVGS